MTDDERVRNRVLKSIYGESIRQGDPGGFVPTEACESRLYRHQTTDNGETNE